MTKKDVGTRGASAALETSKGPLVVRSTPPEGLPYPKYRPYLRRDFLCSCAYCSLTEAEGQAVRFTIDHYEPQKVRRDLVDDYGNLMYACDECNLRKGDRSPPEAARRDGHRFYRPDQDIHEDHFDLRGQMLSGKTNTGNFSIDFLDLNRLHLRRIRDVRDRLANCDKMVAQGVLALRNFHIDQLPQNIKGKAFNAIQRATSVAEETADGIDEILLAFARSPMLDPDPEAEERIRERAKKSKALKRLYPGEWRAPRESPPKKRKVNHRKRR